MEITLNSLSWSIYIFKYRIYNYHVTNNMCCLSRKEGKLWTWEEYFVLCILLLACGLSDLAFGKIRNGWILLGLLFQFLINVWNLCFLRPFCWKELLGGLGLTLVLQILTLFLLKPLFQIRVLGGGDIKLFCVVCGIGDLQMYGKVFLLSFLVAGFMSLWKMLRRREVKGRLNHLLSYLQSFRLWFSFFKKDLMLPYPGYSTREKDNGICFGMAIFLGMVLALLIPREAWVVL